jgi:two-component system response regulator
MSSFLYGKPIEILMVEHNPHDVELVQKILRDAEVKNNIRIAVDGVEALSFLRGEGEYANIPRPDLILLELNIPKKDGREVLEQIKSDRSLKSIPVLVLTTSQDKEDVLLAYSLQANCYITKPIDSDQFIRVMKNIEEFWLSIVKLPHDSG